MQQHLEKLSACYPPGEYSACFIVPLEAFCLDKCSLSNHMRALWLWTWMWSRAGGCPAIDRTLEQSYITAFVWDGQLLLLDKQGTSKRVYMLWLDMISSAALSVYLYLNLPLYVLALCIYEALHLCASRLCNSNDYKLVLMARRLNLRNVSSMSHGKIHTWVLWD